MNTHINWFINFKICCILNLQCITIKVTIPNLTVLIFYKYTYYIGKIQSYTKSGSECTFLDLFFISQHLFEVEELNFD